MYIIRYNHTTIFKILIFDFILPVQIIIKDKRATGVSFVRNNIKHEIMANKEVIVSAGAVNSPQILMLSGIGPKEHLESLEVGVL